VARRFANQFNEHAKSVSFSAVLPEADHNLVEGLAFPARLRDDLVVVSLRTTFDSPEVIQRAELLKEYMSGQHIVHEELLAQGADPWAQKLWLVSLGDWTSYYLALLNHVDPSAIPAITALKGKLRR
jgi:glucose/mannose-6-phosphate isomerase